MDKQAVVRKVIERGGAYSDDFPSWLHGHWPVFEAFESMANRAIGRGRTRLSSKFLFEQIRYDPPVRESGEPFKINNTFTADCARLFDALHPESAGRFEFRERTKAD